MTESGDRDSGKLSLSRPGKLELKKRVGAGKVRQSFSHGRSKQVTVEVKRKRTIITDKPSKDTQQKAGGLSNEERAARARALQARPKLPPADAVAAEPASEAPPSPPPLPQSPEEVRAEQRARELAELKAATAEEQRKQEEIDARRQEEEDKKRAAEEARRDAARGTEPARGERQPAAHRPADPAAGGRGRRVDRRRGRPRPRLRLSNYPADDAAADATKKTAAGDGAATNGRPHSRAEPNRAGAPGSSP